MTISRENNESYLLLTIGNSLVKMRTSNGDLVSNFGENGFVFGVKTLTPPIIYNNLIYVITFGSVKFYDLFSGDQKGVIKIHPDNKDFNQGGVPWGGNALDIKNDILFISLKSFSSKPLEVAAAVPNLKPLVILGGLGS